MLGYVKGKLLQTNPWRGAIKILIVGGVATILGIIVGTVFKV
jgi:VIT1/CCC1 family predicted Fe2+/Mn2+ transporter